MVLEKELARVWETALVPAMELEWALVWVVPVLVPEWEVRVSVQASHIHDPNLTLEQPSQ